LRGGTFTLEEAKSKDFTFDDLDTALELLKIKFERKDRVGEPSTVRYTLKTKGLGGMQRDRDRAERKKKLQKMRNERNNASAEVKRRKRKISPIREEQSPSDEEEPRRRSSSPSSDSKEYKQEKFEDYSEDEQDVQPKSPDNEGQSEETGHNETLNGFFKRAHGFETNEQLFEYLTDSTEMRDVMSDMKSEDLKDQAKEKINAINARIWKSCRNKKSYLATLIKHLAKECHLLSLANVEAKGQLKKEKREATTSREELKEWFDLAIQFKADLRKMKAENDRYKEELDEALGNVEDEHSPSPPRRSRSRSRQRSADRRPKARGPKAKKRKLAKKRGRSEYSSESDSESSQDRKEEVRLVSGTWRSNNVGRDKLDIDRLSMFRFPRNGQLDPTRNLLMFICQ
jgi:hypothetical protein